MGLYTYKLKVIDEHTKRRELVPLTPDRCAICGFSICERNGLGSFADLSESEQKRVKAALAEHKKIHPAWQPKVIMNVDDIPIEWTTEGVGGNDKVRLARVRVDKRKLSDEGN